MIVDDQLHTMPMKFSQGLQQAINREAEVVQGLDNDGIDLMPDNGTKDRRQPWQPVPGLCDADNAINLDGDDRPATREVDQEVIGPASNCNSAVKFDGFISATLRSNRRCSIASPAKRCSTTMQDLEFELDEHCIATVT